MVYEMDELEALARNISFEDEDLDDDDHDDGPEASL